MGTQVGMRDNKRKAMMMERDQRRFFINECGTTIINPLEWIGDRESGDGRGRGSRLLSAVVSMFGGTARPLNGDGRTMWVSQRLAILFPVVVRSYDDLGV